MKEVNLEKKLAFLQLGSIRTYAIRLVVSSFTVRLLYETVFFLIVAGVLRIENANLITITMCYYCEGTTCKAEGNKVSYYLPLPVPSWPSSPSPLTPVPGRPSA